MTSIACSFAVISKSSAASSAAQSSLSIAYVAHHRPEPWRGFVACAGSLIL